MTYRIGYTTGVFDLFHVGHLNILREAKKRCKYLIVGVSTDDVVEEYKHKRPIIPFENRLAIVDSIKYVDEVVAQSTMDKMVAWNELHFDVMFHGSDWRNTEMYNDLINRFEEVGVDVVFLPHTEGVSSTQLVQELIARGIVHV